MRRVLIAVLLLAACVAEAGTEEAIWMLLARRRAAAEELPYLYPGAAAYWPIDYDTDPWPDSVLDISMTKTPGYEPTFMTDGGITYGNFIQDSAVIPDSATMDLSVPFTIVLWVRLLPVGGQYYGNLILYKEVYNVSGYCFWISTSEKLNWRSHTGFREVYANSALPLNEWVHVAFVAHNGSPGQFFTNGVEITAYAKQEVIIGPVANTNIVIVGNNATYIYASDYDQLAIYTNALTAEEIQEIVVKTQH